MAEKALIDAKKGIQKAKNIRKLETQNKVSKDLAI